MSSEKPLTGNDQPRESDKDLTPPHGDELRSEVTFGRTDRHANLDDEDASREEPVEGRDAGGKDS